MGLLSQCPWEKVAAWNLEPEEVLDGGLAVCLLPALGIITY